MKKLYPIIILVLLHFFPNVGITKPTLRAANFVYSDPNGCFASKVVSYSPGKTKDGSELLPDKKMSNYALGQPERNNTSNFVSLGFGGSIVLYFNKPIPNLPGTDLYIVETSEDNCSSEKESAAIYASKDGISWTYIGEGCQDLEIDLPFTLDWANYFKIVDISNPLDFASNNADGYDLDGLESIQCLIYPPNNKPIIPIVECITHNSDGTYTAKFGYDNQNKYPVRIDVGAGNNYVTNTTIQNQPTLFVNGVVHNAFSAKMTSSTIKWEIKGPDGVLRNISADASSPGCIAATIRGNQTICEGGSATVYIDLEGTAPWNISYKDADNNVVTAIAATTPFSFVTTKASTYTLVSATDFTGSLANIFGSATINVKTKPTASLIGNGLICGAANTTPLTVNLTGEAPYIFTYSDGSSNYNVVTGSATYTINASVGKTYSLVSVSDATCLGTVSGNILITQKPAPTALISGSAGICGEGTAPVKIDLTGTAPWTITYSNGTSNVSIANIQVSPFSFEGVAGKTYSLISVDDASCNGVVSGIAVITKYAKPTAIISGGGKVCKDGEVPIDITFTGEAPFMFVYSDGTTQFTQYDYMLPTVSIAGKSGKSYQLISFKDKNCDGTVSGAAQVELLPAPTATIKGSKYICKQEDKSTVTIDLMGTAPFTFTYTDGKTPVTVGGINASSYSFEISGEGSYRLISLQDAVCSGEVSGKADIFIENLFTRLDLSENYCYGDQIPLNVGAIIGGDILTIEWSTTGKGTIHSPVNGNIWYVPADGETGELNFTLTVKGKCQTKTFGWKTVIQEKLDAGFTVEPTDIHAGNTVKLTPNDNSNDLYSWFILKDGTRDGVTGKSVQYTFDEPGEYTVILAIGKGLCYRMDSLVVSVKPVLPLVYVPNIFNLSALHPESRVAKVYGEEISNEGFIFRIYNKWGNVLYEVKDFSLANNEGWNGKDNRSGEIQPLGAYTYTLDGKFNNGTKFHKTGTVTLAK